VKTRPITWRDIYYTIKHGGNPSKTDIVAALRQPGEDDNWIPETVRLYLADLLDDEIDRRGRPSLGRMAKDVEAARLVNRVDRWARVFRVHYKVKNPMRKAFERVAAERKWRVGTAERHYRDAVRLVRDAPLTIKIVRAPRP
jgi:hypothetical protein